MTRLAQVVIAVLAFAAPSIAQNPEGQTADMTAEPMFVLVGTYTGTGSEGIYTLRMDPETGVLEPVAAMGGITNPSFLAVHPSLSTVYAVQETVEDNAVFALALDGKTGALSIIGSQAAHGAHPCHVMVDPSGSAVVVANYSGGSVAAFAVDQDGSLRPASQVIQHTGSGPNAGRQEGPHAHSVTIDPTGSTVLAADLGIDRIMLYDLNPGEATLSPAEPAYAKVSPGAGPRHVAFHPSGRFCYVVTELANTVVGFAYDSASGSLDPIQTVSTLPQDWQGQSSCADIHVHPSGAFLYASNRGHDSIACYSLDPETGLLTLFEIEPTGGKTPRNFGIEPTGRYLYAANQESGNIVQFSIDASSGELTPTGQQIEIPAPVCLVFVPVAQD